MSMDKVGGGYDSGTNVFDRVSEWANGLRNAHRDRRAEDRKANLQHQQTMERDASVQQNHIANKILEIAGASYLMEQQHELDKKRESHRTNQSLRVLRTAAKYGTVSSYNHHGSGVRFQSPPASTPSTSASKPPGGSTSAKPPKPPKQP